jgi:hypothetical protein
MLKLGFSRLWVEKIMKCVKSVSFSILFNGEQLKEFKPTQGIKQCDPISPYLFLLCAEGLPCMLKGEQINQDVQGIQISQTAPKSIIFCLLMIAFFSLKQMQEMHKQCKSPSPNIVKPQVRR